MSNNKEILGLHRITKVHLKELCKKHQLYQTPYLNDQLYLHYQGFQAIENLEEYTGLKCLWLESNAISEIQGLDCQQALKCLFLQNNLIRKIENLEGCSELDTLNLASNHISKIENCGVDVLPVLSSLNLSRNHIRCSEGLKELVNCKSLWSLDLSHNRIDDILVVKIFANMPELRVLVLQGNPVVNRVPQYRKTLILECKNLTYLDSRPVFPKDRACAEAWKRGGYDEERKEHERWIRKDRRKIRDSVDATLRLRIKNGDKEVQLITSTDEEEEEEGERGEQKNHKSKQDTSTDLEMTGVEHTVKTQNALEGKGEKDEENSDSSSSSLDNETSSQSDVLDTHESSGQHVDDETVVLEQDEHFSDEEDVQVVSEELADKLQKDVRVVSEEGTSKQQNDEEYQSIIENPNVCEKGLKENELVTQNLAPAVLMKTASTFSELPTANINSGTYSSSSESSSDSDASSMDYDTNEDEGNDEDDSQMNEFDPKELAMVCDVERQSDFEEETETHNHTIKSRPQESEEDKDEAEKFDPDPEHSNSMSFDELAESQSISYTETLHEKQLTQAMSTNKIQTMDSSDEEDSGLFNSFQTASSFSEVENHEVTTPTCETPTNLNQLPPESPKLDDESLVQEEPSFNPEDINIPDNLEVKSWLKTFLTGLKVEQERDTSDTSSLTDSSLEDFSDSDCSEAGGDENRSKNLDAGKMEKDLSEKIENQDLLDKIFEEISLGDGNLGDGVKGEDTSVNDETGKDTTLASDENKTGAPDPDQRWEEEALTWWEKTLAAAHSITSSASSQQSDESPTNDEDSKDSPKASEESTQSKELSQQDEAEARALLDSILTESHHKIDETTTTQSKVEAPDLSEIQQNTEGTIFQKEPDHEVSDDDSYVELPSSPHTPTLREGLDSFNKVVEIINKRREERLQKINDFVNHPLTKENATETPEQLDQQIEQIKQEKHERVRQLVEHVYAQRDKYDDTLEVIDGRLMVVKRGTGALEEVQPPPSLFSCVVGNGSTGDGTQMSSRYVSCGVSTNSVGEVDVCATPQVVVEEPPLSSSLNDSDSDEYGSALSDEEVEQHQSDTKIKKITYPSMETRTTLEGQDEVSFEKHFNEEREESLQRVLQIHDNIDADIFTEVSKWMDEGGDLPSVSPTVKKRMGREEIALLKQVMAEEGVENAHEEDDVLEDLARIFEIPDDDD